MAFLYTKRSGNSSCAYCACLAYLFVDVTTKHSGLDMSDNDGLAATVAVEPNVGPNQPISLTHR
jgi:hypothetical protein